MTFRQKAMKFFVRWHRRLAWLGGAAVLIWGLSGISHPIMSWTGPKATSFFPPKVTLTPQALAELPEAAHGLTGLPVSVVKIVASANGPLLQITESQSSPRRYFDLAAGEWLIDQDAQQARWLASYYTGRSDDEIIQLEFLDHFTGDYPSVNRLLPVYKVSFTGDDQLQAYIHTETAALASLNDATKRKVQFVFRQLHTWEFLNVAGFGRALLIALMMLSLFLMSAAGIGLILAIKQRKIKDGKRRWHRYLAYGIWLPLMAWSFSGFYHLFQAELVERVSGMHLDKPVALAEESFSTELDWLSSYQNKQIRSVSIVRGAGGENLIRLGLASRAKQPALNQHSSHHSAQGAGKKAPASDGHDHHGPSKAPSRAARFAGIPTEQSSVYFDLNTGEKVRLSDMDRAQLLALSFTGLEKSDIAQVDLITRFGNGYDFRNKRLPVWRVAFMDEGRRHLFIDPTTGVLVDQNREIDRRESWVFSVLHKWNPLAAIGRQNRDYFVVATLVVAVGFTVLGYMMLFRRKRA